MDDNLHDALDLAMTQLFQLRGVLDPSQVAAGLGMSISEAMAVRWLGHGPASQHALGAHLGLEKSTVSRLVDAMSRKGWVDKHTDPTNHRHRTLALTDAGAAAAAAVTAAMRQRHDRMLATLTTKEHRALAIALPALMRALTADTERDATTSHAAET